MNAGHCEETAFQFDAGAERLVGIVTTPPAGSDETMRRTGLGVLVGSTGLNKLATNVWVNDASLLPTAPGVNPQAAVMMIAARNADAFLAN